MRGRLAPEFASLQLTLVDRFVELGLGTSREGVDRLTNVRRRLGLGEAGNPSTDGIWVELLDTIDAARDQRRRLDAVMDAASSLPEPVPEHVVRGWPAVGAFSVQVSGTVARTHFFSMDTDELSPIHPSKLDTRRRELVEVLRIARDEHPELDQVAGGSWLYSTASYRSIFPAAHVATAVVRRGRRTFHGMSHWGQFLDHRGSLRSGLADEFRARVSAWTGDDPCSLFPLDTLEPTSPISVFAGWDRR